MFVIALLQVLFTTFVPVLFIVSHLSLSPSRFRSVALYSSVADKVYALVVGLNVYIELLLWFVFETVVGCTVEGLFHSRLRLRPFL